MKSLIVALCLLASFVQAQSLKLGSTGTFPMEQKNTTQLSYLYSVQGYGVEKELPRYSGQEPNANSFLLQTTLANQKRSDQGFKIRRLKLISNHSCKIELQYPYYNTGAFETGLSDQYPLQQKPIPLQAGVEKVIDLIDPDRTFPVNATIRARYFEQTESDNDNYLLLTTSQVVSVTAGTNFLVQSSASPITIILDPTGLKPGTPVTVMKGGAGAGVISVSSVTGSVQSSTATGFAASQPLRTGFTKSYIQLVWDGTNWHQPSWIIEGSWEGFVTTFDFNDPLAEIIFLGKGDSVEISSAIPNANAEDPEKLTVLNQVTKAVRDKNYRVKPVNRGIAGTSSQGMAKLDKWGHYETGIATQAAAVFNNYGINDYNYGGTTTTTNSLTLALSDDITKYRRRNPNGHYFVLTPNPVQDVTREAWNATVRTAEINMVLNHPMRRNSNTFPGDTATRVHVIDMGGLFVDPTQQSNYATATNPEVHPALTFVTSMTNRVITYMNAYSVKFTK